MDLTRLLETADCRRLSTGLPAPDTVYAFRGERPAGIGAEVTVEPGRRLLPAIALTEDEARHSPDGYEWGYSGSGPAELARAMLVTLFPADPVARHAACYQGFKADVVGRLGQPGFYLSSAVVRSWYQAWVGERGEEMARRRPTAGRCGDCGRPAFRAPELDVPAEDGAWWARACAAGHVWREPGKEGA